MEIIKSSGQKKRGISDMNKLLDELHAHEVELELQNHELTIAQHSLASTRDKYYELFEFAPVGYITLDDKLRITECNIAATNLFGLNKKQLTGKSITKLIDPESQDAFFFASRQAGIKPAKVVCEIVFMKKPEGEFTARVDILRCKYHDDEDEYYYRASLTDISAEKESRKKLHDSEANYRQLFENSPAGMYKIDRDGVFRMANPALLRMLGFDSVQEMRREDYRHHSSKSDFYTDHGFDSSEFYINSVLSVWRQKNGEKFEAYEKARPINDPDGSFAGYEGIVEPAQKLKESERNIHRKNEYLDRILNGISASVIVMDIDESGKLKYSAANSVFLRSKKLKWEQIRGKSPEELKGLIPDEFLNTLIHNYRECIAGRKALQFEEKLIIDDRETYWLAKLVPVITHGRVTSLVKTSIEITESIKTRKELSRSEYQKKLIFDSMNELVIFLDREKKIRWSNRSAKENFQLDLRDGGFMPCDQLCPKSPEKCEICNADKIFLTGRPQDWQIVAPDGSIYEMQGYPAYESSEITGVVLVGQDVTEERVALKTLQKSEERLNLALKATNDAIWDWDIKNDIIYYSPRYYEMLGYKQDEFPPEFDLWTEMLHPDDRDRAMKYTSDFLENSEKKFELEFRLRKKSGEYRWMYCRGKTMEFDKAKKPLRIIGTNSDINDRKAAEEKLMVSERRYRMLFNSGNDAIFVSKVSREGSSSHFIEVNDLACERLGYSREELLGMTPMEISSSANEKKVRGVLSKLFEDKKIIFEHEHVARDGRIIPVEISAHQFELNGQLTIMSIARDITERRETESELLRSRERLLLAQKIARMGDWEYDLTNGMIDWTDQVFEIFGVDNTEEEPTLEEVMAFYEPADQERIHSYLALAVEKGESFEDDFRIISRTGRRVSVHLFIRPVLDESGQVIRLHGTVQDITERKRIEDKLKESERRMRAMLSDVKFIAMMIDNDGRLIFCNKFLLEVTGWTQEEVLLRDWYDVFIPEEKRSTYKLLTRRMIDREAGSQYIVNEIITRSGDLRLVSWSHTVLLDPEGRVIGIAGLGEDITERKKAEEEIKSLNKQLGQRVRQRTSELQRTMKELELEIAIRKKIEEKLIDAKNKIQNAYEKEKELNELKTRFISLVSHEYRTPLTVIYSSAEFLEMFSEKASSEKFRKHVSKIKRSVDSMIGLLNDVLIVGRLESGHMDIELQELDLPMLASEIAEEIDLTSNSDTKIEIINNLGRQKIITDEKLLRHLLGNLLSNAVKYSPDGSPVHLELENKSDTYIFRIIDRGIGIRQEDLRNLFEPFHRGKNVGSISGSGFGLSIAKGCADKLGGEIQVESRLREGSIFTVELPLLSENRRGENHEK
ncbi:MAG: PAS domain S-box protein [Candidatus Kapaibacterium sp.]